MEVETVAMETKPTLGDGKDSFRNVTAEPRPPSAADPLAVELAFNSLVANCTSSGESVGYPELRSDDVLVLDTGQQTKRAPLTVGGATGSGSGVGAAEANGLRMTPEDGLSTPPLQPDTTLDDPLETSGGTASDPIRCEDCGGAYNGMAEYYQHRCCNDNEDDDDDDDVLEDDEVAVLASPESKQQTSGGSGVAALYAALGGAPLVTLGSSASPPPSLLLQQQRGREVVECVVDDYESGGSVALSDVETFDGKIVYNPDGSAYIIEAGGESECSGGEEEILPRLQEGSIVEGRGLKSPPSSASPRALPPIVNAFHVSRGGSHPHGAGALNYGSNASANAHAAVAAAAAYGQAYASLLHEKKKVPEAPIMHSYRVYSVRDQKCGRASDGGSVTAGGGDDSDQRKCDSADVSDDVGTRRQQQQHSSSGGGELSLPSVSAKFPSLGCSSVPVKPILMCFICKLSFGTAKSFTAHAMGEHSMALIEEERGLMNRRNTSAIVQGVGKDKTPLLSFLEPVLPSESGAPTEGGASTHASSSNAADQLFGGRTVNNSCASSLSGCDAATSVAAAVAASLANSLATTFTSPAAAATSPRAASPCSTTATANGNVVTSSFSPSSAAAAALLSNCLSISAAAAANRKPMLPTLGAVLEAASAGGGNAVIDLAPSSTARAAVSPSVQDRRSASPRVAPLQAAIPLHPGGSDEPEDGGGDGGSVLVRKVEISSPFCSKRTLSKQCKSRVPVKRPARPPSISNLTARSVSPRPSSGHGCDPQRSPAASSTSSVLYDRHGGMQSHEYDRDMASSVSPRAPSLSPAGSGCQAYPGVHLQGHSPSTAGNALLTASLTPSLAAMGLSGGSPPGTTTAGVCSEHPNGRPGGVECPKCDTVLGSSRSLGGHMTMMHSRNSCKTLKCPKCNWHYKYQETLEIHMKEKHPENETTCIYCITNQPHPRLARGETYTCGYKPYRCDVCNYSTTTKGNLSIHMQSDKHLNNMQELQNGGGGMVGGPGAEQMQQQSPVQMHPVSSSPVAAGTPNSSVGGSGGGNAGPNSGGGGGNGGGVGAGGGGGQKAKPKPTWRCDVCNYETNVARNLRIHMTSEKHTHNMMVLQQNVKHMQQLSAFQAQAAQSMDPALLQFHPGLTLPGEKPPPHTEAALADMAYNQALLIQLMTGGQLGQMPEMQMDMGLQALQESLVAAAQAANSANSLQGALHANSMAAAAAQANAQAAAAAAAAQSMGHGGGGGQDVVNMSPGALRHSHQQQQQQHQHQHHQQQQQGVGPSVSGMPAGQMPMDDPNVDPHRLFQCCVCSVFGCDAVEQLSQHLQHDRTKQREHEILMVMAGNYVCKLCSYKTNLKANFQLHCKTDKHLQRLQHINHIKEGGARNEWKLKYLNVSNPIQVKCNACNYYTNSTHKLQLHAANPRHELDAKLFGHLQACEMGLSSSADSKYYHCALCNFCTRSKVSLIQHVHSLRHMRSEGLRHLHPGKSGAGGGGGGGGHLGGERDYEDDLGDMLQVRELADGESIQFDVEPELKEEDVFENDDQGDDENDNIDHGMSTSSMLKQALLDSHKMATAGIETRIGVGHHPSVAEPTVHSCPCCNYTCSSEVRMQAHVLSQHTQRPQEILCPLCQEDFKEKSKLEKHLMHVHNVTAEGLQRLLLMVDNAQWLMVGNPPPTPTHQPPPPPVVHSPVMADHSDDSDNSDKGDNSDSEMKYEDGGADACDRLSDQGDWMDEFRCHLCLKCFKNIDELYAHQNELGHFELKQTPRGPGYLCWKKGCNQYFKSAHALQVHFREIHARRQHLSVSERHVYKYRCSQCSLAFKTMDKLQLHSQYHIIRDATKCVLCGRSFRSIAALQRHVETAHIDLSESELEQYRISLANNPLLLMGIGGQNLDAGAAAELLKKESTKGDDCYDLDDEAAMELENSHGDEGMDMDGEGGDQNMGDLTLKEQQEQQLLDDYLNSQTMAEDSYNNPFRKYKCHRCKVAFTKQSYLTSHNKTLLHRKGERLSYPMEKYLDPNRPYKCDVCKESFTQKNILLVHYNSVSHLHKLKRSIQEQNSQSNSTTVGDIVNSANGSGSRSTPSGSLGNSGNGDNDKKPYKCNICKVAYSQGSTLDIHMRSVLHQTRASKLQELALTGQVDLTQPLIEQPDPQKTHTTTATTATSTSVHDQQKKVLAEMLNAKASPPGQLNVSVSAAMNVAHLHNQVTTTSNQVPIVHAAAASSVQAPSTPSPGASISHISHSQQQQVSPMSRHLTVSSPIAQPQVLMSSQVSPQAMFTCQRCGSIFGTHDTLVQHQQLYCFFQPPIPMIPTSSASHASLSNFLSPKQSPSHQQHLSQQSLVHHQHHHHHHHPLQSSPSSAGSISSSSGSGQSNMNLNAIILSQQHQHQMMLEQSQAQMSPSLRASPSPQQPATQQQAPQAQGQQHQQMATFGKFVLPKMKSSSIYKHLMESYGFELVMQFNEYHQKRPRKDDQDKKLCQDLPKPNIPNLIESKIDDVSFNRDGGDFAEVSSIFGCNSDKNQNDLEKPFMGLKDLPEIAKSVCPICGKEFSSIWVLKAHKEEIHNSVVPLDEVEKFSEEFKTDYDKRNPPQVAPQSSTPDSTPASEPSSSPADLSATPVQTNIMMPPVSMANTQQLNDFNAAINAMAASQMSQMPFNHMMLSMGLGLGLPLGMSMPAMAAMNLHPPLIPIMMPPPMDQMSAAQAQSLLPPGIDPAFLSNQQKQMMQNQTPNHMQQQQKRARTRINDEQLKILRAHFDINNSPTEEQIMNMAEKSGLPPKVIKHWFRNTLFKERQRNKDSPYNFNNPPSTALNIEEYEKTGETHTTNIPISPLTIKQEIATMASENGRSSTPASLAGDKEISPTVIEHKSHSTFLNRPTTSSSKHDVHMPVVSSMDICKKEEAEKLSVSSSMVTARVESSVPAASVVVAFPSSSSGSAFGSVSTGNSAHTPTPSSSSTPSVTPTLSEPTTSQSSFLRPNPSFSPLGLGSAASAMTMSNSLPTTPTSSSPLNSCLMNKGDCSSSGKRANRTRFTDYQIKVLQEFFESNAYPKDDDLEYLSKLLNLSPRVIVVWFQNARQKARKVYENQPPVEAEEDGSGRFQRTPGLNYQCKKCLLVFQRYYELIKHQKSHCFKGEEDQQQRMRSQLTSTTPGAADDTNSVSSSINDSNQAAETSSDVGAKSTSSQEGTFRCDKCSLVFPRFDLWREHQIIHIMNPNLFPTYPPDTPFGILQYEAQQAAAAAAQGSASPKRKLSEDGDDDRDDQPRDKRLRTTILPEQLDYLYQKYQIESNPSRKMLENIAREVGLKKRVVQVWFQNTRARERKGQFRAHQQVINKRCPFCPALFKVKSALESHLATKHADQYSKGEINIDSLPDEEPSNVSDGSGGGGGSGSLQDPMKLMITSFESVPFANASNLLPSLPNATDVQNTLKKYYEDSLKRYIDELTLPGGPGSGNAKQESVPTDLSVRGKPSTGGASGGGGGSGNGMGSNRKSGDRERDGADTPLDLSKPVRLSMDNDRPSDGPLTDHSERSSEDLLSYRLQCIVDGEGHSDSHSESTDNFDGDDISHESNPGSPCSSTNSHNRSFQQANKRYRTQMTTLQLKLMKTMFSEYKTPTMAECEMLGREIGLPKRVVQVWFQNARAKEKKNKLALAKAFGQEVEISRPPEKCKLCNFKYSHKYSIQDHIFTKKHIDNAKCHIVKLKKYADENKANAAAAAASGAPSTPKDCNNDFGGSGGGGGGSSSQQQQQHASAHEQNSPAGGGGSDRSHTDSHAVAAAALAAGHSHLAQLHMMQMAAAGLPVPTSLANMSMPVLAHTLSAKDMHSAAAAAAAAAASSAATSVTASAGGHQHHIKQEPKEEKGNKEGGGQCSKGGATAGAVTSTVNSATAAGLQPSLVNPFADLSGLMTGDTAGLLPYMYSTGIPGYYPGSFFHPAMYSGRGETPSKILSRSSVPT